MHSKTLFLAQFMGVITVFEAGWMILRRDEALSLIHEIMMIAARASSGARSPPPRASPS